MDNFFRFASFRVKLKEQREHQIGPRRETTQTEKPLDVQRACTVCFYIFYTSTRHHSRTVFLNCKAGAKVQRKAKQSSLHTHRPRRSRSVFQTCPRFLGTGRVFNLFGSSKYLVETPTAGPSADTRKLTALPSRFATETLRLRRRAMQSFRVGS